MCLSLSIKIDKCRQFFVSGLFSTLVLGLSFFWEVIFLQCEECEVLAEIFEHAICRVVS